MSDIRSNFHSGGCCGITTLRNFFEAVNDRGLTRLDTLLNEHKNTQEPDDYNDEGRCRLIEVVLNEREYHWHEPLIERGFTEVVSFRNANSGRVCTVYHQVDYPMEPGNEDANVSLGRRPW